MSGCGWLLIITGAFATGVALFAWLIRLELDDAAPMSVWVTDGGTRYHDRECAALSRSEPHEMSLHAARAEGLEPCHLCEPPA